MHLNSINSLQKIPDYLVNLFGRLSYATIADWCKLCLLEAGIGLRSVVASKSLNFPHGWVIAKVEVSKHLFTILINCAKHNKILL